MDLAKMNTVLLKGTSLVRLPSVVPGRGKNTHWLHPGGRLVD